MKHRPKEYPLEDNVDDFMATIMLEKSTPEQSTPRRSTSRRPLLSRNRKSRTPRPDNTSSHTLQKKPKVKYQTKKKPLITLMVVVTAVVIGLLINPIMSYYSPKTSPFEKEIKDTTNYPLLYPSKVPAGYSIDASSISRASDGAMLYSIKDSTGNIINVSLQPRPEKPNLQPLLNTLKDLRELDTPAGKAVIGMSPNDITTVSLLADEVWLILRAPQDLMSRESLDTMLRSLRKS